MHIKYLFLLLLSFFASPALSQQSDNYKPDNPNIPFCDTNLPIVFIDTYRQTIEKDELITARMVIIDNGEKELNQMDTLAFPHQQIDYDGYIGLRYRGNSSFWQADKKPYSIRPINRPLEDGGKRQKVSLLGMSEDNDWALLSLYADKSLIRDVLGYTLAQPFFEYVPSSRFCEVIIDSVYYGVYSLSERVRKGNYRLDLPDPGTEGDDLSGGYHIQVDRDDEPVYYSKYPPLLCDGTPLNDRRIAFQYKNIDYDEMSPAQLNYIHNRIDAFEDTLKSDLFKDPNHGYRKHIDVTSFIDYLLSTEFCRNVDGYRLSTNLYKYRDSKDPRFKTTLWDLNLGFGNANYANGWKTYDWAFQLNDLCPDGEQLVPFWWQRFFQDETFVEEVCTRWELYRSDVYTDKNIVQIIDSLCTYLNSHGAIERNSKAWPRWGKYVWPNYYVSVSHEDEISYLKEWIKRRTAFMDKHLLNNDETGVESDVKHHLEPNIYPLPARRGEPLFVEAPDALYMQLCNIKGQILLQQDMKASFAMLNLNTLTPDVYLLVIHYPERRYTTKIFIN